MVVVSETLPARHQKNDGSYVRVFIVSVQGIPESKFSRPYKDWAFLDRVSLGGGGGVRCYPPHPVKFDPDNLGQ